MLNLLLLTFISCVAQAVSQNYEIEPAVVATCDTLARGELTCRNCETLARCVLMGNVWRSFDVDKCDSAAGLYCNSFEQRCSSSPGHCNRFKEFVCSEEGYFPNPFTCQEYYICLMGADNQIVPYPRFCESGTGYSAETQACTLELHDSICLQLLWECKNPGDIGLWPGSDNIFYICQRDVDANVLLPQLHRCPLDQLFDEVYCVNRNSGT